MSYDKIPMIAWVDFKEAFRQSGCPICHLQRKVVERYIFHLLWENVNDVTTRVHLARSLGFCPEHTWQLYHTEISRFGSGLGISIIYEDLARSVVSGLRDFEMHLSDYLPERPHWWQRGWAQLRAALRRIAPVLQPTGIIPAEQCQACVYSTEAEERYIHWLVEGCADSAFSRLYTASDGLCLLHLRQTLAWAAQAYPDVARFLAGTTAAKLETLSADLSEYARKQAWQYRHEKMTEDEQNAPRRASQFFGGLDRWNGQGRGMESI